MPRLTVAPERTHFDLRSTEDDARFHTDVSTKPNLDLVLRGDESGAVGGGTHGLIGQGDMPFVEVSDSPVYEPLPSKVASSG